MQALDEGVICPDVRAGEQRLSRLCAEVGRHLAAAPTEIDLAVGAVDLCRYRAGVHAYPLPFQFLRAQAARKDGMGF